jgi:succinate dehydrogenase/fumarate reductase flavoprotein subunit
MEIDVTHMVQDRDNMVELSGSRMEHGQDAGRITWNNSKAYAAEQPLLNSEEDCEEARTYFAGFGAWDEDEIAAWSEEDLQAIMCQDVAAAIREMELAKDYEDYERLCEAGTCSGRLYRNDDGRWYFYVGD